LGHHEDLPAGASVGPPSIDLGFPEYFSKQDHRHVHDPLNLSISSISRERSLPPPNQHLNLAANWTSDTDQRAAFVQGPAEGISALALADKWSAGSASASIQGPAEAMSALDLADKWSAGSAPGKNDAGVVSAIELADKWSAGSASAPGKNDAGVDEDLPAPKSNPLLLAEAWDLDVDQPTGTSPALRLAEAWQEADDQPAGQSQALLADEWTDTEVYGDEELPPAPSTALRLAEEWDMNEDSEAEQTDFNYGPEHFSYLNDEMFEDSSSDEEE
jgi:hypothetical protein